MAREQVIRFGDIEMRKVDEEDQLYFLSGKRLYVIGAMSGDYPPLGWRRPGFLVGKRLTDVSEEERPVTAAHFLYEMGGVWAHPIKALENIYYAVAGEGEDWWELRDSYRFENHLAFVDFFFQRSGVAVRRRDFVAEEEPALFSLVRLENSSLERLRLRLRLQVESNLMPSWFSGWRQGADIGDIDGRTVVVTDAEWPDRWAVVFGSDREPDEATLASAMMEQRTQSTLIYLVELDPGERVEIPFLYVSEHLLGTTAAQERFRHLNGRHAELLSAKIEQYDQKIGGGTRFRCSDQSAETAFYNAKANLVQLQADLSPYLGRYFYAGLPEYVQLFGTDTAYSIPGISAIGQTEWARESLRQLARFAQRQCGRVPHEVTTNGRVFHPGNTQETPQFAIAAWEYYRWSGDRPFLEEIYQLCQEGVLDYLLAHWDADLDYYPDGNSMVERAGMGPEKLDSIVYFCRAVYSLAAMAGALGREEERQRHLELATALRAAINHDFWMENESLFADSLNDDHTPRLDGHWTVVTPMEADVADRDKGGRALARIEQEWVNQYGMVHTRHREELVWTLPTGLLALAAFRYGHTDLGWKMLSDIASTTATGTLGTYKELIPEGLCFMQLWSPAIFLQGLIEGLFGISPRADLDSVDICPKLPTQWRYASLEKIQVGDHELDVALEKAGGERVVLAHRGPRALSCRLSLPAGPGTIVRGPDGQAVEAQRDPRHLDLVWVDIRLAPGEAIEVVRHGGDLVVQAPPSDLKTAGQRLA